MSIYEINNENKLWHGKERGESGRDTELMWGVCVSVHGCVLVFGEGRGLR